MAMMMHHEKLMAVRMQYESRAGNVAGMKMIARKRSWIIVPTLLAAVLSVAAVNLITPRYKSEVRILIDGRENVFLRPNGERNDDRNGLDAEAVTSQVQLLLSRDLARDVIQKNKLAELPEFDPVLRGFSPLKSLLALIGIGRDPLSLTPEERVLDAYYDRFAAYAVDKSRVIVIEFQSRDPDLAARVANSIADGYLVLQQGARRDQARSAGQWLAGEIENLRKKVAETPAFERAVETRTVERAPLRVAVRDYGVQMLQAFGLSIVGCIANFVFVVYLVAYAINTLHLPPGAALSCAVASGSVVVVLTPFVGMLTDRIGRRPLILACAVLNLLFDYPLFVLALKGGVTSLMLALVCNAVFQAMFTGAIPSTLSEMFPTRVRYTALSVSYGFAVVLFGGFAPLISTWLKDTTGSPYAPAFYVMTGAALSAIAILSMKEYRNVPLD